MFQARTRRPREASCSRLRRAWWAGFRAGFSVSPPGVSSGPWATSVTDSHSSGQFVTKYFCGYFRACPSSCVRPVLFGTLMRPGCFCPNASTCPHPPSPPSVIEDLPGDWLPRGPGRTRFPHWLYQPRPPQQHSERPLGLSPVCWASDGISYLNFPRC